MNRNTAKFTPFSSCPLSEKQKSQLAQDAANGRKSRSEFLQKEIAEARRDNESLEYIVWLESKLINAQS